MIYRHRIQLHSYFLLSVSQGRIYYLEFINKKLKPLTLKNNMKNLRPALMMFTNQTAHGEFKIRKLAFRNYLFNLFSDEGNGYKYYT